MKQHTKNPPVYSQSIVYGTEKCIQGDLCNGWRLFAPSRTLLQSRALTFSRVRTSSRVPRPWMCSLGRNLAAAQGHRHFGNQANYLGVLHNVKFANSLIEKPLEEGLAAAT